MKKYLIVTLFLLPFLFYYSCSRKDNVETSPKDFNSVKVNNIKYPCINLNINNNKLKKSLKTNSEEVSERDFLSSNLSSTDIATMFSDLKNYFGGDIDNSASPNVIILYTLGDMENISFADLKGISIFTTVNGVGLHKYYSVRTNSNTLEDTSYTKTCTYFFRADIHALCELEFGQTTISWAQFSLNPTNFPDRYNINSGFNNFGKKLVDDLVGAQIGAGLGDCGICPEPSPGGCHDDPIGGYPVCGSLCGVTYMNEFQSSNSLSGTSLDTTAAYSFRNFLNQTNKGQQYIVYYNKLSYLTRLYKPITLSTWADHVDLAYDLYVCADILENGNATDIPISSNLRTKILSMLTYYRSVTTNGDNQQMFDEIEVDVDNYVGMTRSQILNAIN